MSPKGFLPRAAAVAAATALVAACSGSGGVPGAGGTTTTAGPATSTTTTTTTAPVPVLCPHPSFRPAATVDEVRALAADDPGAAAIVFAEDRFECAADVVVVSAGDLERVALAAHLAAALQGPLLFAGPAPAPGLEAELARLIPQRIWLVGGGFAVPAAPEGSAVEVLERRSRRTGRGGRPNWPAAGRF